MQQSTLILGLGNVLMTDEGVGAEVVRRLACEIGDQPGLQLLDGGTLSFTLAAAIADNDRLIVVDAASMGEPAGSVRVFEGDSMDRHLRGHAKSVHEVSLSDLFDIARLTDTLPERRALVGIEPRTVDWGDALTPPVADAIPAVIARIRALLVSWDALGKGAS